MFGFLVDRVGRFQLEEFIGATYLPLARVVEDPDIIREEEGHVDFGTNATAEFTAKGGEHKERIQRAVNYWYAKGLDMFGNSKSYRSERYMFWGLKRRPNAVARQEYKDEIDALILKYSFPIPTRAGSIPNNSFLVSGLRFRVRLETQNSELDTAQSARGTMQPAANTDALDQQFKEFIQALKGAVNSAMPHLKDDPKVVDKAITDCKEILDVVMEGNVKEWLS